MSMNRYIPVMFATRLFMLLSVLPGVLFLSSCERVDIFEASGGGTSSGTLSLTSGGFTLVLTGNAAL